MPHAVVIIDSRGSELDSVCLVGPEDQVDLRPAFGHYIGNHRVLTQVVLVYPGHRVVHADDDLQVERVECYVLRLGVGVLDARRDYNFRPARRQDECATRAAAGGGRRR